MSGGWASDLVLVLVLSCWSLLGEIRFDKTLVVAARDEANFLRVGFSAITRLCLRASCALRAWSCRRAGTGSGLVALRQSEEKVSLVLGSVSWTLQQPTTTLFIKFNLGVVASSNFISANLLCHNKKLVKLQ